MLFFRSIIIVYLLADYVLRLYPQSKHTIRTWLNPINLMKWIFTLLKELFRIIHKSREFLCVGCSPFH